VQDGSCRILSLPLSSDPMQYCWILPQYQWDWLIDQFIFEFGILINDPFNCVVSFYAWFPSLVYDMFGFTKLLDHPWLCKTLIMLVFTLTSVN
jgi:hypothetical protein